MSDLLDKIISSSEVLALLMPLIVILIHKPGGPGISLIRYYVFIAFFINLIATLLYLYYYSLPPCLQNNNILYNIHSFIRVVFFGLFIIKIRAFQFPALYRITLVAYLLFCIYNFVFAESPLFLSSKLFSAESIILLFFCISYFLRSIREESDTNWLKHPSFLICAGICLYEAVNFFIFLFFYPLYHNDEAFSLITMRIYAITFIILCTLLAIALYKNRRKKIDLQKIKP